MKRRILTLLMLCILAPLALMAGGDNADLLRRLAEADSLYFTPGVPTECEAAFVPVLREALASDALNPTERSIAEWKLSVCLTNAEDSVATDFCMRPLQGAEITLSSYVASDPALIIMFDPDCWHCREVIKQLREPGVLPPALRVMAVCVEGEPERWRMCVDELLDPTWDTAYDMSGVIENDLYILRAMPSVYLLKAGGTVALKNPSIDRLKQYFSNVNN
jgi:hypothetical protein